MMLGRIVASRVSPVHGSAALCLFLSMCSRVDSTIPLRRMSLWGSEVADHPRLGKDNRVTRQFATNALVGAVLKGKLKNSSFSACQPRTSRCAAGVVHDQSLSSSNRGIPGSSHSAVTRDRVNIGLVALSLLLSRNWWQISGSMLDTYLVTSQ